MANLLFFDEGHRYQLDGEELPSVSELCRFITREIYGDVSQYTLDRAADRGTAVHKACEALDIYGKVEISEDITPYLKAYLKFRKEHSVTWDKVEQAGYHKTLRYAGTIDRRGTVDGKSCIVDLKTTCTIHKQAALAQLNLYRMIEEQDGDWKADDLYILQLRKDETYRLVSFPRNEEVPSALLTLNELMKRKGKKKNG